MRLLPPNYKLKAWEKKLLENPPKVKPYGFKTFRGRKTAPFLFSRLAPDLRPKAHAKLAQLKEKHKEKVAANPALYHRILVACATKSVLGMNPGPAHRYQKWASLTRAFIRYPDLLRRIGAPAEEIAEAEHQKELWRQRCIEKQGAYYKGFFEPPLPNPDFNKRKAAKQQEGERTKWLPLD